MRSTADEDALVGRRRGSELPGIRNRKEE